jgi:SM-20-related protein
MPPAVQLGFYPCGTGAKYTPHLDRNPGEVGNRREITFLLYLNADWDVNKWGGQLRLHPDPTEGRVSTVDVEPLGGRIVVFKSGEQVHEVMPCEGRDRLALTLWCEYE